MADLYETATTGQHESITSNYKHYSDDPTDNISYILDIFGQNGTNDFNNRVEYGMVQHNFSNNTTNPRMANGAAVLLLLILNLLGNSTVLYIYHFRVKPTVFSLYVKVLACLDLITATTTMLCDVIMKMRPLDEDSLDLDTLCKVTHFQVYSTSLVSGCVLTLIAYQRYRKICHPLEPGMKMRTAQLALAVIVAVCTLMAIPTLIINGPQDIKVRMNNDILNVTICRYDKIYSGTSFQQAFSIFLAAAFTLVLCLTVIFYVMVARALKRFERHNSIAARRGTFDLDALNKDQGYTPAERRRRQYQQSSLFSRMSSMSGECSEWISTQMFRVFAIITIIFIVSYLPHLIVLVINKSLRLDYQVLAFFEMILLDAAYNCPYISTVANPVVYGFRSAEFREHLKNLFSRCS